jgi:hypothetical protein
MEQITYVATQRVPCNKGNSPEEGDDAPVEHLAATAVDEWMKAKVPRMLSAVSSGSCWLSS